MAKKRKPNPDNNELRLTDLPVAVEAAKEYLHELTAAHVPYSIRPEFDELTGRPSGIQIAVDVIGTDGFCHWVVLPFAESGMHPDGFTQRHLLVQPFERESMSPRMMADGLSRCRVGLARPAVVTRGRSDSYFGTRPISVLEFHQTV